MTHKSAAKAGIKKFYVPLVSVCAIVSMWLVWLIAYYAVGNEYVVPSVGGTVAEIGGLLISTDYWLAFCMTLLRTLGAWAVSCVVGAALSAVSSAGRGARAFIETFVSVFRTLPVMAVTLMLLIWTSRGVAPMIVAFLTVCPIMYAQLMAAYDGIDGGLRDMAAVYGVSRFERIVKIYFPQMLPPVLAQTGANISLALKVIISAEVLSSTFRSLGGMINDANMFLRTSQMFALTITVLVAGGLIEWSFGKLARITDKWTGGGVK